MAQILIVDDTENIRRLLAITLRHHKHEVAEAGNGQEALESLRREMPDLVISDIEMPVMNGLKFLEALHEEFGDGAPPVLMLTGEKERVRAQALQLGARDVLVKPFTPLDLYKRIEEHLP